ncbi:MAG: hypothetical protein KH230_23765 [Enterocloster asparagiformis]|nr:hypothetical protein [Enterocloster asparagiformis]
MNMKKNRRLAFCLCAAAIVCICLVSGLRLASRGRVKPSEEEAVRTVCAFAEDLNYHYKEPERLYDYLTEEFQAEMSREEFVRAFNKERSYPYLTPLFINYESVELAEDARSGTAVFSQAARLPGMVYELPFVYENGAYRVIAFENFPDGSYLEKFDKLTYSLDSYFDNVGEGEQ